MTEHLSTPVHEVDLPWHQVDLVQLPRLELGPCSLVWQRVGLTVEVTEQFGASYQVQMSDGDERRAFLDVVTGGLGDVMRGTSRFVVSSRAVGDVVVEAYEVGEEPVDHRSHWFAVPGSQAWASLGTCGLHPDELSALLLSLRPQAV